jgi:hypothetical protein
LLPTEKAIGKAMHSVDQASYNGMMKFGMQRHVQVEDGVMCKWQDEEGYD